MRSAAVQPTEGQRRLRASNRRYPFWQQMRWASARVIFCAYIGFSVGTFGLGGFLTGPLMTWYFYGDWRFWRVWHSAKGLYPHAYRMLWFIFKGQNGGFMLDVPLTAPPHSSADTSRVELNPTWEFGRTCGPCNRCCTKIECPVLDRESGLCRGYDSFFWRYFNCGRFPTEQRQVDYYLCNKWQIKDPPNPERQSPSVVEPCVEMVA